MPGPRRTNRTQDPEPRTQDPAHTVGPSVMQEDEIAMQPSVPAGGAVRRRRSERADRASRQGGAGAGSRRSGAAHLFQFMLKPAFNID